MVVDGDRMVGLGLENRQWAVIIKRRGKLKFNQQGEHNTKASA